MPRREEHITPADTATCECDPCKRKKGLSHNVHSGVIHEYSSQPARGWAVRRTTAELACGSHAPTFGIELETSIAPAVIRNLPDEPAHGCRVYGDESEEYVARQNAQQALWTAWNLRNNEHRNAQAVKITAERNLTADEAVSTALPRALWHAKYDSSVSGPEFASHPATLAYWRLARPHVAAMMKALLHGGIRSHDGDTCGLHVNIGTDAFDVRDENGYKDFDATAAHLERFAHLVTMNPRWSTRMSQRTHESVNHWAPITGYLDYEGYRKEWAESVARFGRISQDRYCVLNARPNGRVEFRLPRGTLRVDRFYAKLEWTAAMVEYTRDPVNVIQISAFMRWGDTLVNASGEREYPALVAFMRERFSAERFGEKTA